ncbi:MAG: DUF1501 domain-containing protein [Pirellulales bacterium]|nr:DUF1501 domain-containing protein [Pirellulales bacterium]
MKCTYACGTADHLLARRQFLGSVAAGLSAGGLAAAGLGTFVRPAIAEQIAKAHKRVLVIWLSGGVSQLETWDPKPGTDTGGPTRAISTSVPGVQIADLLPHTAQQMHRLLLIRGVNTAEDDHGKGYQIMHTGRRPEPSIEYPHFGSLAARLLEPADASLPGYIHITPGGGGGLAASEAAYLGPRFGSVTLGNGAPPQNTVLPQAITETADAARNSFRGQVNDHFSRRRRTAETEAYSATYDQAAALMRKRELFDVTKEPAADQERYGNHDLGRHCLLARRLLENGVTFVKVSHSNYDTHNENFNFHIEQLGEFDRTFATLIDDLAQRGMLDSTLVVVKSEFGRTPNINHLFGRDHWSKAWSVALAGCGLHSGGVYGATNDRGTEVVDGQVNGGHLFHTYFRALGLDSRESFTINGRPLPIADPSAHAIEEVLA